MKKIICFLCILMLLFSLTACGNVPSDTVSDVSLSEYQVLTESVAIVEEESVRQTTSSKKDEEVTESISESSSQITESVTKPSKENTTGESEKTTKSKDKKDERKTTEIKSESTSSTTKRKATTDKTTKPQSENITSTAQTSSVPKTTSRTTNDFTEESIDVCVVTIVCATINENLDKLKDSKKDFVPTDGIILNNVQVEIDAGDTAFDVIKKACESNVCNANCRYCQSSGVQLEYTYNPGFKTYYIEGIHQIYEKDCGSQSGWMYSVNGVFPSIGSSSYTVKSGDKIIFAYTCNMGEDIGNTY